MDQQQSGALTRNIYFCAVAMLAVFSAVVEDVLQACIRFYNLILR
jgi:hypothetical protein